PSTVPVQPIAQRTAPVGAMFSDLQKYASLLELVTYDDDRDLRLSLKKIIIPAIQSWLNSRPQEAAQSELAKREFEYDVFVSYSERDNEGRRPGPEGWMPGLIDKFKDRLFTRLTELMGESPRIFLDKQHETAGGVHYGVLQVIDRCAVFVVLVSKAY